MITVTLADGRRVDVQTDDPKRAAQVAHGCSPPTEVDTALPADDPLKVNCAHGPIYNRPFEQAAKSKIRCYAIKDSPVWRLERNKRVRHSRTHYGAGKDISPFSQIS